MTSKEFNKKYKLSFKGIDNPFQQVINSNTFTNVAGKPKKLLLEIFKRFFKNWVAILFLVVFIFVLSTSLFVTSASPYDTNINVSNTVGLNLIANKKGEYLPTSSEYTGALPTKWREFVYVSDVLSNTTFRNVTSVYFDENQFSGFFGKLLNEQNIIKTETINGNVNLLFNPYKWYTHHSIFLVFVNSQIPQGLTHSEYQVFYNEALQSNPQLNLNTFLGTSKSGIDIWTQSWVGTWKAIRLAIIIVTFQTLIGVAIGSYLGFHVGTWIDTIIMRLIDIFSAPPTLVWLLLFVSLFGTTDTTLAFSMIFVGWVGFVARTRLFIITVKDSEFITASKSVGASKARLIYKHALPGIIGKIATSYVSSIPSIILSISSLAFLGFFKTNKDINLGQIISAASSEAGSNFWILLLPSLILLSISVSLHFIALGVHDALDPKVIKTK
ncbi:ABC transporter permease [Mycoplasmopsis felis]|uniref:Oligopeptide transport system permease protein OppC n=2 Tax=Mycoplasmopsis felis TaxID=33923 RepID=A0A809RR60_9BACT|nr:ABC transporter permease [Mycoplasmopsis felis]BBU47405.1 oligopeptide transport system permease protein OppC [Mycoplasmopsis felis]